MVHKSVFIFDVDGTLVDAYTAITRSLNYTRRRLGYPKVSQRTVHYSVGRGDVLFIAAFFKETDRAQALQLYRAHHAQSLLEFARLRPGASTVLAGLKKRGKRLAVASNRPSRFTKILLDRLKITRFFDLILCADEAARLKPDPKILGDILKRFKAGAGDAVYVGDMDIDMECAERAGVDAVFIRGGSSTLAQVKKYRHKKVISDLRQLLTLQ